MAEVLRERLTPRRSPAPPWPGPGPPARIALFHCERSGRWRDAGAVGPNLGADRRCRNAAAV